MNKNVIYALLMVASLFTAGANAAPMAYSVNSDSSADTQDHLYLIDLGNGAETRINKLDAGTAYLKDTEGLAFTPGPLSLLWGIDDEWKKLFQVATSGIVYPGAIELFNLQTGGSNDVGMTFACDGNLYFTSVDTQSLYRHDPSGKTTVRVGGARALGVNISAIAAIGNPTRLYGLGNGLDKDGKKDSPNLYSIDTTSGVATMIGALSETDEFKYHEAGLDFDSDGVLWAITDRSQLEPSGSQILQIDVITGAATLKTTTKEAGYESLAIAPPTKCSTPEPADELPGIPTLSLTGSIFAILVLMLAGIPSLRRRSSKAKI